MFCKGNILSIFAKRTARNFLNLIFISEATAEL